MRCPACKDQTHVMIEALTTVRVTRDEGGELETEPVDACHEYDDRSVAWCDNCNYVGTVMEFDPEVPDA